MKILVIGHTVEDHILRNGAEIIAPGGIYYTSLALNSLMETYDKFFLLTSVPRDYSFFYLYKKIDSKYFIFSDEVPRVWLKIFDEKERAEKYENITRNLEIDYNILKDFDAVLINMITGFDLTVKQITEIRENFRGLIYLDIHTLSRGLDDNMKRKFRVIPEFEKIASSADIIQCNSSEAQMLFGEGDEKNIAEKTLSFGARHLIITKQKFGAKVYSNKSGEINFIYKSALKIFEKNKIGCGDVFGAAFFYNYLKTENVLHALTAANTAAGIAAGYDDLNQFEMLKNDFSYKYN